MKVMNTQMIHRYGSLSYPGMLVSQKDHQSVLKVYDRASELSMKELWLGHGVL